LRIVFARNGLLAVSRLGNFRRERNPQKVRANYSFE
jgi:hypothetical protein